MFFIINKKKNKKDKLRDIIYYLKKRIYKDFPFVKTFVDQEIYFYKEIQFYNLNLICWNNLNDKKIEIVIDNWVPIDNFEKKKKKIL